MIIRIIFIALAIGVFIYLFNLVYTEFNKPKRCPSCKGAGFWRGTRGEKNTCKVCGGSGVKAG